MRATIMLDREKGMSMLSLIVTAKFAALCCLACLLGSQRNVASVEAAAGSFNDNALLRSRIHDITTRKAWQHRYTLPEDLLARAYSLVGDDSRLRKFVRKLVLGEEAHYAHLGGSMSVFIMAKRKDNNWHTIFHKWLELAFTPCGKALPTVSAREVSDPYLADTHLCPDSTVHLHNYAIGATSCIFAEKCLVQKINPNTTDWVLIEYTQNAIKGLTREAFGTPERRALERLLRKVLGLPSRPAVMMFHTWNGKDIEKYGDHVEDWHNLVAQYYSSVQATSLRASIFDLCRHFEGRLNETGIYMPDATHPLEPTGHHVYADVMIYTFKKLATEVMGELLLESSHPALLQPVTGMPLDKSDGMHVPLPPAFQEYFTSWQGLPPPLVPGNDENSDGDCFMGEALPPLVVQHEGWTWVDESMVAGRHKWGYVSETPGSKLVLEVDSTINGVVLTHAEAATQPATFQLMSPPPPANNINPLQAAAIAREAEESGTMLDQVQTNKGILRFSRSHAQVMVGYLASYEKVGFAQLSCISGCSCNTTRVQAQWKQRYSTTSFVYLTVTASRECRIQVEVLPPPPGHAPKFKVEGIILNARPYFWNAEEAGGQYRLTLDGPMAFSDNQ